MAATAILMIKLEKARPLLKAIRLVMKYSKFTNDGLDLTMAH